jgi:hypothetical protein
VPLISDAEVAGARQVAERCRRAALFGTRKSVIVGQPNGVAAEDASAMAEGQGRRVLLVRASILGKFARRSSAATAIGKFTPRRRRQGADFCSTMRRARTQWRRWLP